MLPRHNQQMGPGQQREGGAAEANQMETLASETLPQSPRGPRLPIDLEEEIQEDGNFELLGLK